MPSDSLSILDIELWAIRIKPSGAFMPHIRLGRGYTALNPEDFTREDRNVGEHPRLFKSKTGAQRALRAWLKGEWRKEYTIGEYGEQEGSYGDPPSTPPVDRRPEDIEIVRMRLTQCQTI